MKAIALALASFFGFFGVGHSPATTTLHPAAITTPVPFPTCPPLPHVPISFAASHASNAKHANTMLPPIHVCPL